MIRPDVLHYYRLFREHGHTAEQAYWAARSHINFRKRLGEMVRAGKRRSRAARKGWKTRRGA